MVTFNIPKRELILRKHFMRIKRIWNLTLLQFTRERKFSFPTCLLVVTPRPHRTSLFVGCSISKSACCCGYIVLCMSGGLMGGSDASMADVLISRGRVGVYNLLERIRVSVCSCFCYSSTYTASLVVKFLCINRSKTPVVGSAFNDS